MAIISSRLKFLLKLSALSCGIALTNGCAKSQPDTFTFTADLPNNFVYQAIAEYVPVDGETCTVPGGRNTAVVHNPILRKSYVRNSEIAIYRMVSGCKLVIHRIKLDIHSKYGNSSWDFGEDFATVVIRSELEEKYKNTFNEAGESSFYGQCEWLFRTMGPKRRIVKLLDCKATDALGKRDRGHPFSAYTLDQLQGTTVKMKITLAAEERPGWGDTWVQVPGGWKRCMGKSFEDQDAFCFGNYSDFSTFKMPDGRICTIYPGCTE
ncbi:hypothetical protein ACM1ZW_20575 [Pseudomonas sp. NFX71]|uniref:hypothetical protein n=1 Tax=Pseudomonas sp. NFX71 TaxID=3399121 RepID=UPI003A8B6427